MDKQKIDQKIDKAAAQTKETVAMFSEKIDAATQCATDKGRQLKDAVREGTVKAADKVEEVVSAAADRVRAKAGK